MTIAPSPFSPSLPTFQTAWDSTSLGWLKKCPRLYYYHMIGQWSPRSKGIHLAFGGWYARGLELHAHYRAQGLDHDTATLKMIAWALEATGKYTIEIAGEPVEIERALGGWNIKNGAGDLSQIAESEITWTPWESGDEYKNRYTLIRSLVWNVDDLQHSPWQTLILSNGKPAVELSFNFEAFTLGEHTITLSGHMDKIVTNQDTTWVCDDKTSKSALTASYFAQFTPHNQMSLYSIAGKIISARPISGVLIRAAQIGVGFTRFATQQAPRPVAVLNEWLDETKRWIGLALQYAEANHWPMNDTACNDYGGCAFRRVCSVSPAHRKSFLLTDFEKRVWNPLEARGE